MKCKQVHKYEENQKNQLNENNIKNNNKKIHIQNKDTKNLFVPKILDFIIKKELSRAYKNMIILLVLNRMEKIYVYN